MNSTFKVGDGVNWGFNGDYNPGTVERVTKSRVWVRRDKVSFKHKVAYGEVPDPTFERDPEGALEVFSLRKATGRFRLVGMATGWALHHGREWARNPSF